MPKTKRNEMPMQPPDERVKNFTEAALGFDESMALSEAARCLGCKKPRCVTGCPLGNHIPEFIAKIKARDYEGAMEEIRQQSDFASICSRVCPQEEQCENKCILAARGEAVAIGSLERFVADFSREKKKAMTPKSSVQENSLKAAVIGSGPAGLSVANELNKLGYQVTVFEAESQPGGILYYGIPEFRLPKATFVEPLIADMKRRGIKFITDVVVGEDYTIDMLMNEKGYASVFVATGAGATRRMNIVGETADGVYGADLFLAACTTAVLQKNKDKCFIPLTLGNRLAVIGGGNVAMDVARSARRLGIKHVYIVYRRGEADLPAREDEAAYARQEGVEFLFYQNPLEIIAGDNGRVRAIKCVRTKLSEAAEAACHDMAASETLLEVDTVVMAIGQQARTRIKDSTKGLDTGSRGYIIVDETTFQTTCEGVFAGGDVVTGAATVAKAIQAGKLAAQAMHDYMKRLV